MRTSCTDADLVRRVYRTVAAGDRAAAVALVDEWFAEDAVLALPESLPYGGVLRGRAVLRRVFGAAASPGEVTADTLGPRDLTVTNVTASDGRVVAELAFNYHSPALPAPIPMTAVEVWRRSGGLVAEIRAYYGDTAACLGAGAPALTH